MLWRCTKIQLLLVITTKHTTLNLQTVFSLRCRVGVAKMGLFFFLVSISRLPSERVSEQPVWETKAKVAQRQIKHEERIWAPTGVVAGGVARRARTGAVARKSVPRAGCTRGGAGGGAKGPRLAGETLGRVGDACWAGGGERYWMTFTVTVCKWGVIGRFFWPSIWMFFRKTGFTTLVPIRTPPVLQYRMLLPDFRFTYNTSAFVS